MSAVTVTTEAKLLGEEEGGSQLKPVMESSQADRGRASAVLRR